MIDKFQRVRLSASCLLIMASWTGLASAQTTAVWNGGTGNWNDAASWSTNPIVPNDEFTDVRIDGGKAINSIVQTGIGQSYQVHGFGVGAGDTLEIETDSRLADAGFTSRPDSFNQGKILIDGGELVIHTGTNFDNTGGLIEASNGGKLTFGFEESSSGSFTGGTLRTLDSSVVHVSAANFSDVTLDAQIEFVNQKNRSINDFSGSITNQGFINLNQNIVFLEDSATLTGGGVISMGRRDAATLSEMGLYLTRAPQFFQLSSSASFTIENQSIRGYGLIATESGSSTTNFEIGPNGVIDADYSFVTELGEMIPIPLVVTPGVGTAVTNHGVMRASAGELFLKDGTYDNTDGVIEAINGSRVLFDGDSIVEGGTLRTSENGQIAALESLSLRDIMIDGNLVSYDGAIELGGHIENRGVIRPAENGDPLALQFIGTTFLSGGGRIDLGPSSGFFNSSMVHNTNHTIEGGGAVLVGDFINEIGGVILANEPSSALLIPISENSGKLHATNSAILSISAVASSGLLQADVDSMILTDGLTSSSDGLLTGNGLIGSSEEFENNGRIAPGASVGQLTLEAAMVEFGFTSTLETEIDSSGADLLTVMGDLMLDGVLEIDLLAGFIPSESDIFQIVQVLGGNLTGTFAGVADGETVDTVDGRGRFIVDYTSDGVFLSGFVTVIPEPSSIGMLAAIGLIASVRRRRTL